MHALCMGKMRDLTQHLTARADDNHAPLVSGSRFVHFPIARCLPGPTTFVFKGASFLFVCRGKTMGKDLIGNTRV